MQLTHLSDRYWVFWLGASLLRSCSCCVWLSLLLRAWLNFDLTNLPIFLYSSWWMIDDFRGSCAAREAMKMKSVRKTVGEFGWGVTSVKWERRWHNDMNVPTVSSQSAEVNQQKITKIVCQHIPLVSASTYHWWVRCPFQKVQPDFLDLGSRNQRQER